MAVESGGERSEIRFRFCIELQDGVGSLAFGVSRSCRKACALQWKWGASCKFWEGNRGCSRRADGRWSLVRGAGRCSGGAGRRSGGAPVALIWQDVIATSLCDVGGGEPTRRSAGFLLRIRLFHPGSLRRDVEAAVSVACRKDFEVRSALNFWTGGWHSRLYNYPRRRTATWLQREALVQIAYERRRARPLRRYFAWYCCGFEALFPVVSSLILHRFAS